MENRFKVERYGRKFIVVCTATNKCTDYTLPEWQDAQNLCSTMNASNLEMQNREVTRFFIQRPTELVMNHVEIQIKNQATIRHLQTTIQIELALAAAYSQANQLSNARACLERAANCNDRIYFIETCEPDVES